MHAHRSGRMDRVRTVLLALLFPAFLALAAPAARAESPQVALPALTGPWSPVSSPHLPGGVYYTILNAEEEDPSATALWKVLLPQAGQYQIYITSVPTVDLPRTTNAQYLVSKVHGTELVGGVDQNFGGERLLGTFSLNAGTNTVQLTNATGEPAHSHSVVASAARWVLVTPSPPPSPPPPPPSPGPTIAGYLDNFGNSITAAPPGTPVIVIGNNFGFSGTVAFAGFNAPIVRYTPTAIRVLTPLTGSYPTIGPVTVTSGGQTGVGPNFDIDPNAPTPQPAPRAPVITGYAATNPRGVPIFSAPPGAPVLIEGGNFGTGGSVTFNGIPAFVASWSSNELLVTVPQAPYYPDTGPVAVFANGQSGSGPQFTITASGPPPSTGDWVVFMHDSRQLGLADSALDPRTLAPWSVALNSQPGSSPVVLGGVAYVGTAAGVYAIDTATGTQRWFRALPAPVRSAPAATPQVIVVSGGGLYGLSPFDGSVLWQRPDIVANPDVSPMLLNGTIYIGAAAPGGTGAAMYAVSAAYGTNVWPAPALLPGGFDNRATVAADPQTGLLFAGLGPPPDVLRPGVGPSAVVALHLADGTVAWSGPAMFPGSAPPVGMSIGYAGSGAQPGPGGILPTLVQSAVFVAAGQSVTALSSYTGAVIWTRALLETSLQGPPVLSTAASGGSTLYVGGASGHVYALNSLTGGDAAGSLVTPIAPITGTMALAGTTLYLPTTAALVAVDVTTGLPFWTSSLSAASGVAVAGGKPYVATADGRFVGFGP